jgi:exopolyphosphatase/guanosine-5'-triphosphate,3'-diphosphate pyrophosphatase
VAAIDAGSNTIHLVVARPESGRKRLRALLDDAEMVRLGADVTEIGAIGPERAQRAIAAVRRQLELARSHGATEVLGIATEGVRRAANAQAFLDRVRAETGLRFSLITGDQEAALAFWGVTSESPEVEGARGVIDLGGGSLELAVGDHDEARWRASLPLGAGATRARLLPTDPPTFREIIGAYDTLRADMGRLPVPLPVVDVTVSGGTATALATVAGRAFHKHAERRTPGGNTTAPLVSGQRRALSSSALDALIRLLMRYDTEELTRRYRLKAGRAPLLIAGALTLYAGMERFGVDRLWISHRGIREGALCAWQRVGDGWLDAATSGSLEPRR